jgi:predicted transcriptional regulator
MNTITISLSDERAKQLREIAERFGVRPEDLVRISVEELLAKPDEAFKKATDYVLKKNRDLYDRLA